MTGFERVVASLPEYECSECVSKIRSLFESNGMVSPSASNRTYTRYKCIKKNNVNSVIPSVRKDLSDISIPGMSDADIKMAGFLPSQDIIATMTDGKLKNIAKLYAKLGWEAGRCLAGIHRSGFVWGTFTDHNLQELHCNAHTDNLVILEKTQNDDGSYQILAPVDFDMSFREEQAVNFWMDPAKPDRDMVRLQFGTEVGCFIDDVSGLTACIDGVSTAIHARKQPEGVRGEFLWIIRDIICYECMKSYLSPIRNQSVELNIDDAYDLIISALAETHDQQS